MTGVNPDTYLSLYAAEYAPKGLKESQREGIAQVLSFLAADDQVTDSRWAAYMLATVKHECAGTWQPIMEYDLGKGRPYGEPDPETHETYYGRGYVQLTWKGNYKAMSAVTGIDLVAYPNLAMRPDVAYRIMSYGMRNGSFTGVGLRRYIDGEKCDYTNARKIINGLDCAAKIAAYATTIEGILRRAA